jgi:hypothetical protein
MGRVRRIIGASAIVTVLLLAGCSAAATDLPDADPSTGPSTVSVDLPAVTDVESCEAFSDISTILQNANAGFYEGRMSQQEFDGWMRLATRVLDRVPTSGVGPVSEAIDTLKELSPAIPAGTIAPTTLGSSEWMQAAPLAAACEDAGYTLAAEGFTGG